MYLLNDFYSIENYNSKESSLVIASIQLNSGHKIFSGHFPNLPVVPGVCLIQIVKEVLSHSINKKLILVQASSIKYLSVVDPRINTALQVRIEISNSTEGFYSITAVIFDSEKIFMKFTGKFSSQNLVLD